MAVAVLSASNLPRPTFLPASGGGDSLRSGLGGGAALEGLPLAAIAFSPSPAEARPIWPQRLGALDEAVAPILSISDNTPPLNGAKPKPRIEPTSASRGSVTTLKRGVRAPGGAEWGEGRRRGGEAGGSKVREGTKAGSVERAKCGGGGGGTGSVGEEGEGDWGGGGGKEGG